MGAEDAAAEGVVYIEPAFGCADFFAEKWPMSSARAVWDIVLLAGKVAEERTGVIVRWMVAGVRTLGPESVMRTAKLAASMVATGEPIVSFGLHASEGPTLSGQGPFPPEPFAAAFKVASQAGLVATPHAGEFLGAGSCHDAVKVLKADRLQHGVRAVEDQATLDLLSKNKVCCDICPTSNVLLQVVPSLEKHPLPKLVQAGVPCSINVDDSLMFGSSIVEEYTLARDTLGLSDEVLRGCAYNSLAYSGPMLRARRGIPDTAVSFLESYMDQVRSWDIGSESSKKKQRMDSNL